MKLLPPGSVRPWLLTFACAVLFGACMPDVEPVACVENSDCPPRQRCSIGACVVNTEPSITIVSPQSGFINSNSAVVDVEIQNFDLKPDAVGGERRDGEGHWHLYVDDEHRGVFTGTRGFVTDLGIGEHLIEARLAYNNHQEVGVQDQLTIERTSESRALTIVSPTTGPDDAPFEPGITGTVLLELDVQNFTLSEDSVGGEPLPCNCEGHIHVLVDNQYVDLLTQTNITLQLDVIRLMDDIELGEGEHVFEVRLVHNNHDDIEPRVFDTLAFEFNRRDGPLPN